MNLEVSYVSIYITFCWDIYIYVYIIGCFSVCAVFGLFHGIGREVFKSNTVKFINISALSGTFVKISISQVALC